MRSSLLILLFFVMGVACGHWDIVPAVLRHPDASLWALYALLVFVGFGVGSDSRSLALLRDSGLRILLVPLSIVVGTLLGAGAVALLGVGNDLRGALAVGAGFGYYSISSIIIGKFCGAQLGAVALLANICRELLTFILAPVLVRCGGRLAPIAAGGATSMDTTLVAVSHHSGKEYVLISLCSGIVLTFLVPLLVTLILTVAA